MTKRICRLFILFMIILLMLTGGAILFSSKQVKQNNNPAYIIDLNEIEQLAKKGQYESMYGKIETLQETLRTEEVRSGPVWLPLVFCGVGVLFMLLFFGYMYFAIARPFEKMKQYAERIAAGDLSLPLDYERSNYFGEFTWSFDSMRREITKARACEREAIANNKTVIATLSHDIKTPIASIRAYSEGLEAMLDDNPEKRAKYLQVIMRKCDEVSSLTNDLFLHSLSDLDKLQMYLEKVELWAFTKEILRELTAREEDVTIVESNDEACVEIDKNRYTQLVENLINNARKYAKTKIEVSFTVSAEVVKVAIRDFGRGIADEDLPFIFDQFYRGRNAASEPGSGLGLYIVKHIVGQMRGEVTLVNETPGLLAVISLPRDS